MAKLETKSVTLTLDAMEVLTLKRAMHALRSDETESYDMVLPSTQELFEVIKEAYKILK